ncbi:MAG: methionyl-tRNA formyltransferase [Simkania sp.]|nr:methionyl-tRNA formyltransferase [Simkania sp.]
MNIVFFGTSSFAGEVFAFLQKQPACEIIALVTRPDRPRGRDLELQPSPLKAKALALGAQVPLFQPIKASTEEFAETLRALSPDLFVVVAYGEIIKQNLLDIPRFGCINIHASLLPKYRGAAPIQRAIMNGERETGITIIEMVQALDAGPMLKQKMVLIQDSATFGEVEQSLLEAACCAVLETIHDIEKGSVLKIEQDHEQATYASKLRPEDERLDWNKPAEALYHQIRALSPFPGAWCFIRLGQGEKRLKIRRAALRKDVAGLPGEILERSKSNLIVACGEGSLQLLEVQIEGKKSMPIQEFLQGSQRLLNFL